MTPTLWSDVPQQWPTILDRVSTGEEIVIERDGRPIARLIRETGRPKLRPAPGLGRSMISIIADDDEHLRDFHEYLP